MKKLLFAALMLLAIQVQAQDSKRFINVLGTAQNSIQADQADISLQVKTIEQSSASSKKQMDAALKQAVDILKKNGIEDKYISVSPVLFGKNYEYNEKGRQQTGFYSMVTVNVLLKDLARYYDLMNQLSVVQPLEIVSANYSLSNIAVHNRTVYEKALAAAREKAEYMAKAMGVELGQVLEIDESMPAFPQYSFTANVQSRAESPDPAFSGKVMIEKTLRVRYELAK